MSRYQLVGTASDATGIADALNTRRKQLGLTMSELNDLSGFAGGYVNKVFAAGYKKDLGRLSLPIFLEALGCKLAIIADDEAIPAITRRAIKERHLSPSKVESSSRVKRIA